MSEPNPQEFVPPPVAGPALGAPSPTPPRRRLGPFVVVAVVALLVGIGGTAAAFVLYEPVMNRINPHTYTFTGSVFLKPDVTPAEQEALQAALDGVDAFGIVRYESRDEAYENFKELYKDSPDLVESVRPETLPASFRFETSGTDPDFDCGLLDPIRDLPGIDELSVTRFSKEDRDQPIKQIDCP